MRYGRPSAAGRRRRVRAAWRTAGVGRRRWLAKHRDVATFVVEVLVAGTSEYAFVASAAVPDAEDGPVRATSSTSVAMSARCLSFMMRSPERMPSRLVPTWSNLDKPSQ